jgi:hypothetical protein
VISSLRHSFRPAIVLVMLLGWGLCVPSLRAQAPDAKHEAQLRSVSGVVIDKSDSPIAASVVFLKNTRTNTVRSYISDNSGNYRFSGLDPNADYELHAEKDGAKSQTRTISSFDSRKEMVLNLKLDKKKP